MEIDYLSPPIYISILSRIVEFLLFLFFPFFKLLPPSGNLSAKRGNTLRYDILPSTFLFIREENISWAIVGGSSRKITFSRVKLPLISRCVINFTRTNASREIPRRRGASCDVSERNGARSSSTTVLFSLAQVVYSRDKPETGRYVRSIHPTTDRVSSVSRASRKSWRWQTVGEFGP